MIFDLAIFLLLVVATFRLFTGLRREAEIIREFKQNRSLSWLVLLFPAGPLLVRIGAFVIPISIVYVLAAACYVPALVIARRQGRVLETSGTDRVQGAQKMIANTFGAALIGMIYLGVSLAFTFAAMAIVPGH